MTVWTAIIGASLIAFALKFAGYTVPPAYLEKPRVSRVTTLLPAALLAALVVMQTFTVGSTLVLDARAAGLVAAIIALLLRAPFIVVVIAAAATAAALRALLGWP
ncbi:MAG: branched-chain amino acid transport [Glaciihabitans sp.]|nr:branched-chain amino acid transport [Glaciihabitans sp.]